MAYLAMYRIEQHARGNYQPISKHSKTIAIGKQKMTQTNKNQLHNGTNFSYIVKSWLFSDHHDSQVWFLLLLSTAQVP